MRVSGDVDGNQLELSASAQACGGHIALRGTGSRIRIGEIHNVQDFALSVGSHCSIDIADQVWVGNLKIFTDDGATIVISSWAGFNGVVHLYAREGKAIHVGPRSLFADLVELTTGDSHAIFDLALKKRVNHAGDIHIGEQVWLCAGVRVMKNVKIGAGSVIGAGAVVTRDIPAHCMASGVPAKVLRRGITWDQRLLDDLPDDAKEFS